MYDVNMKNVKKGYKMFFIPFIMGMFILIIIGWIIISNYIKLGRMDSEVISTSVEIKKSENDEGTTMYSPVYYYEVDNVTYSCSSSSSSSSNPGTKNNTVYYDSTDPEYCMTEYSKSSNNIIIFSIIIPLIFIVLSIKSFININKKVKKIKYLNENGKLIKNLDYQLMDTGSSVNGVPIQMPVVEYTLKSGLKVKLYGDSRYDKIHSDSDGMIDLLIDENDENNYFLDFEINRLSGNLPTDYSNNYQGAINNNQINNNVQPNNNYNHPNINNVQPNNNTNQSNINDINNNTFNN